MLYFFTAHKLELKYRYHLQYKINTKWDVYWWTDCCTLSFTRPCLWVLRTIIRGLHRCRIGSLRAVGPGRNETCLPDFERLYAYVGYEYCCCSSEIVEVLCTPELFLFPRNMEKKHGKQGNDLYSNESTSWIPSDRCLIFVVTAARTTSTISYSYSILLWQSGSAFFKCWVWRPTNPNASESVHTHPHKSPYSAGTGQPTTPAL